MKYNAIAVGSLTVDLLYRVDVPSSGHDGYELEVCVRKYDYHWPVGRWMSINESLR